MKKGAILISLVFLSGVGSVAAPAADGGVRLPPYLVTAPLYWRYAAMPGFEILSSCPDDMTKMFIQRVYVNQAMLDAIAPGDLQVRDAVPTALILFNKNAAESEPELKLLQDSDSVSVDIALDRTVLDLGARNFSFDPAYVFSTLAQRKPPPPLWFVEGALNFRYHPPHEGLLIRIFENTGDNRRVAVIAPPAFWVSQDVTDYMQANPGDIVGSRMLPLRRILTEPPPPVSGDQDKELWFARAGLGTPSGEVPGDALARRRILRVLRHGADAGSPWLFDIWKSEAALLVRWALDDPTHLRREALWSLARYASTAPVTEATFQDFFQLSFLQMDIQLAQYLPAAMTQQFVLIPRGSMRVPKILTGLTGLVAHESVRIKTSVPPPEAPLQIPLPYDFFRPTKQGLPSSMWKPNNPTVTPKAPDMSQLLYIKDKDTSDKSARHVELRDATAGEKARILGDWERKEIDFVKDNYPQSAGVYIKQAESTLMGGYDHVAPDPGLLAALGLYGCTIHDDVRAREFLEAAVDAGVVRPRAYVELARLRYKEALANPGGAGGTLDPRQTASVLDLLQAGRLQPPPQVETYLLAAQVWEHAAVAPTRVGLLLLDEGVSFFPDNADLVGAAAQLHARAGVN